MKASDFDYVRVTSVEDAVAEYNARIASEGLPLTKYRTF